MSFVKKELLFKHKVIENIFEYQDLESEVSEIYTYFENSFLDLFENYSNLFNINDCCFYLKNDCTCNAFARKRNGYNIIGITNGYPILMTKKLNKENFKNIVLVGISNEKHLSEAYCDLEENIDFDFSKFILDCSIRYTFHHEFQHILQLNCAYTAGEDCLLHENLELKEFDIKRHAWEYYADRMASFEVLKYTFSVYRKLKAKSDDKLKCLLFVGCASIFITRGLFYFGLMNQIEPEYQIKKIDFYTNKNDHPHPIIRSFNLIEYYFSCIIESFPRLKLDFEELFINVVGISKLYFDTLVPKRDIMSYLWNDLRTHLDDINQYNNDLYDYSIHDETTKNLLISRGIDFERG